MFYLSDYKIYPANLDDFNEKPKKNKSFSVLLNTNDTAKIKSSKYSLANAAKPLVYVTSLCGIQLVRYGKEDIHEVTIIHKLYCLLVVITTILLITLVKPAGWLDTRADVPLNILTKAQGTFYVSELLFSVVIISFRKSADFVHLFKALDSVDAHFDISKEIYKDKQIMAIVLSLCPILQVTSSVMLRKFDIRNLGLYITIAHAFVQGSFIIFFILNIYEKYLMFNKLLMKKLNNNKSCFLYKQTTVDAIMKIFFKELVFVEKFSSNQFCWFELMQIYDEISDCMTTFNKIFVWQVFMMFNNWLLSALLILCRNLSPTLKKFHMFWSDLFLFLTLNMRPMFLAKMCDLFIEQRKKTLSILLHVLLEGNIDDQYYEQVQAMIDLVETKKLEITANVYVVNVPTVMNFSGRAISFAVLMIQYFYMHQFEV